MTDLGLFACSPEAEYIVGLVGFSLVLGWLLCAMVTWWLEDRAKGRRKP